ncbi:MAG: EamA family transporter [Actinomycetota bacterium]|nr:EamA family transporter [Actinomycetota bacterium]
MLLTGVLVAGAALLVPPVLLDPPTRLPDLPGLLALAALGLLGTGAAFVMYWLIGEVGPERTLLVTYLAPAFAVAYGALLLDEPLGVPAVAGLVLVVGVAWLVARQTSRPRVVASVALR